MASLLLSAAPRPLVCSPAAPDACSAASRPAALHPRGHPRPQGRRVVTHAAATASPTAPGPDTLPWYLRPAPENVKHISSVQELVDALAEHREQLVIVEFFAPWCAACRTLYPKICKMAAEQSDVVWLCINFDESRTLVKGLGIKVLPYFHFYRGAEGRVAEFTASTTKVQRLRDAIALHNTPRCSLGGPAPLSEFPQVVAGAGDSSGSGEDGSGPSFSGSVDVPEGVAGTGCGGCSENGNGANGNGNGAHGSLPPPIIAGPFDGDALMA